MEQLGPGLPESTNLGGDLVSELWTRPVAVISPLAQPFQFCLGGDSVPSLGAHLSELTANQSNPAYSPPEQALPSK
jgi:hypothetical protein